MRKSKEIMFLFALLIAAMIFVLWYVIDRRAKNRAAPPVAARTLAPEPPPAQPVALGGENERKTIDFSTGQPVVKDSPEDKAVIDAALKEMAEATKEVTFEARPAKQPEPAKK